MSIASDTLSRLDSGDPYNYKPQPYRPERAPLSITPGATNYPEWSSSQAVREGYESCSVLAQVIGDLGEKAASRPWFEWEIGTAENGADTRLDPVPYLEDPDPFNPLLPGSGQINRSRYREEAITDYFLSGHSYEGIVWRNPVRKDEPQRLRVEDPDGVAPVLDRSGRLAAWEWQSSSVGGYRYWESADVIQVPWRANPRNRHLGFTLLWPLGVEIDSYVELTRMQLNRIRKGAAPGQAIKIGAIQGPDGTTNVTRTEEARLEVEESLNRGSAHSFGGWKVMAGEWELQDLKYFDARSMQLLETLGYLRDRIWTTLGPHPALISSDASTLDNLKVAERAVWARVVLLNNRWADAYTQRFIPARLRGKRRIGPDYSDVPEIQALDTKVGHLKTLVKDCEVTVGSARRYLRMELEPQPGEDLVLVSSQDIPKEQAGEPLE